MNKVAYSIIIMVTVVGFAFSALLALAIYLIDKNADRHDKRN
jgi:uncharacterized membrane protein YsdA (DUF1294 family)